MTTATVNRFFAPGSGRIESINSIIALGSTASQAPDLRVSVYTASSGIPQENIGRFFVQDDVLTSIGAAEPDHRITIDVSMYDIRVQDNNGGGLPQNLCRVKFPPCEPA